MTAPDSPRCGAAGAPAPRGKPTQECKCKGEHIFLYGVVSFDWVDKQYFLHSIDRTQQRAEEHKLMVQNEYRMKERRAVVRIEKIESDHAFAAAMKI